MNTTYSRVSQTLSNFFFWFWCLQLWTLRSHTQWIDGIERSLTLNLWSLATHALLDIIISHDRNVTNTDYFKIFFLNLWLCTYILTSDFFLSIKWVYQQVLSPWNLLSVFLLTLIPSQHLVEYQASIICNKCLRNW